MDGKFHGTHFRGWQYSNSQITIGNKNKKYSKNDWEKIEFSRTSFGDCANFIKLRGFNFVIWGQYRENFCLKVIIFSVTFYFILVWISIKDQISYKYTTQNSNDQDGWVISYLTNLDMY